ncbi:hypothetical protein C0Q70_14148 [Pomacea canaliculata]|uniref:Uncharacterized protein n=1 Tax=Pomacea canaliculata TaxID=400727 RepID=A0A2T7NZ72_POMCA|nr:hypothetical protein C0Q70_14148 [Pomacea canaliculata]
MEVMGNRGDNSCTCMSGTFPAYCGDEDRKGRTGNGKYDGENERIVVFRVYGKYLLHVGQRRQPSNEIA